MKKLLFILISIFLSSNIIAQDVPWGKLTLGDPVKKGRHTHMEELLGFDENNGNIIILKTNPWDNEMYLEKYSSDLEPLGKEIVKLKVKGKYYEYHDAEIFQGRIVIFTTSFSRKKQTTYYYFQEYDVNTLKPLGEVRLFDEELKSRTRPLLMLINPFIGFSQKQAKIYRGYLSLRDLNLDLAEDHSRMMLLRFNMGLPGEKLKFKIMIFDENFDISLEETFTLDYTLEQFTPGIGMVNNDGSFIIVGLLNENERVILGYDNEGKDVFETRIDLEDYKLFNVHYTYLNDSLAITGFYGKRRDDSFHFTEHQGADGMFFGYIDTRTGDMASSLSFFEFADDMILEDYSERRAKRLKNREMDLELLNYYINNVIPAENGEFYVTAEYYDFYTTTTTTRDANGFVTYNTTYHYVYQDILVARISASGEVKWVSRVDKYQHTTNDGGSYSSYIARVHNDNLYLLYNTRGEEKDREEGKPKFNIFQDKMGAMSMLVRVNPDGSQEGNIFHDREEGYVRFIPQYCDIYDYNKVFLWGHQFKKEVLGIYTITE